MLDVGRAKAWDSSKEDEEDGEKVCEEVLHFAFVEDISWCLRSV